MQTKWINSVTYAPEWLEVDTLSGVSMTIRVSEIATFAPIPMGITQEPRTRVRLRCGTSMDVLHTYQQIKDALRGTDTADRVVRPPQT